MMRWPMDGLVAWTFLGMDALADAWAGSMELSWFGHGCTGRWMGWWHGRYHGLGMDALVNGWAGCIDGNPFPLV